jgi:hypothetical protein
MTQAFINDLCAKYKNEIAAAKAGIPPPSIPPPLPRQVPLPAHKPIDAATFQVPVKKSYLPDKKDQYYYFPSLI